MGSLANPDLKMMQSNLLMLLLLNLAFAAALDNVPEEEETNRVHRRLRRGPKSSAASEKRTQFMEECAGDSACVRGKMRDWRKAKKAGEASLDRGPPVAQFAKECNYDMACIRRKLDYWNLTGLSGSSIPVGGMGASYGRMARELEPSSRYDSEDASYITYLTQLMDEELRMSKLKLEVELEKLAQLLEELMEEFKMIDWSKTEESGEASIDRRVHHRRPSSTETSEKRTQFMEECGGDAACVRGKMKEWRKAKKAGEASF